MPEKTAIKMNGTKRHRNANARKSSGRAREKNHRQPPAKIETVQGVYGSRIEAENALTELKREGFRIKDISTYYVKDESDRRDVVGTAARMTGMVLGVSAIAVTAPMILALQILGIRVGVKTPVLMSLNVNTNEDAAEQVADVLVRNGASKVGLSGQFEDDDLKRREYRDETGQIHHHPHTYLRDHADELRQSAA